jgi:hypothetical protein
VSGAPAVADSPDWDVRPEPRRVVAVGDLHGDLRAFGAIGRACGLLDERGGWRGGATHLVLMGDLVGGEHSRLLLNAIMRLEREALRVGGRVHALLGNHDLLPIAGRFGKLTVRERREYRKSDFQAKGRYAEWVLKRPTILKIGRTLYVHAGLDRWALDIDPGEVNAHVRAWIAHLQGIGPRPPRETRWTFDDDDGPMWTRAFRPRGRRPKDAPSKKTVRAVLERLDAERIVLGHSPADEIVLDHPHYGESVVLIDTRISDVARGRLGALAIEGDTLRPVYARDRTDGNALLEREVREAEKPEGLVHRVLTTLGHIFQRGTKR